MNILVLGSSGTLGNYLCNYLIDKGLNIIKWDLKNNINQDLRIKNNIEDILQNVDYVIFLAFDVGGSKYNVYSKEFIDNNMKIILNTFDSLFKYNKPFIYTTSCMSNMIDNPYGSLKNISEHYVYLMNGINVKLWNVYGNEEINEKSHVIPDFINEALNKNIINMRSDGSEIRQFLHCKDFSEAIYLIMINHNKFYKISNLNRKSIDISSYKWISIYEVALKIKEIMKNKFNKDIEIIKGPNNDNHSATNNPEKSELNILWEPKISIEKGINFIIDEINQK